jgi:hypothetical protein
VGVEKPQFGKTVETWEIEMSIRTEIVACRASNCKVFSTIFCQMENVPSVSSFPSPVSPRRQGGQKIYWDRSTGKVDRPVQDSDGAGPSRSNAWLQSGRPREERLGSRIGEAEIEHSEAYSSSGSRVRFSAPQAVPLRQSVRPGGEGRQAQSRCGKYR